MPQSRALPHATLVSPDKATAPICLAAVYLPNTHPGGADGQPDEIWLKAGGPRGRADRTEVISLEAWVFGEKGNIGVCQEGRGCRRSWRGAATAGFLWPRAQEDS